MNTLSWAALKSGLWTVLNPHAKNRGSKILEAWVIAIIAGTLFVINAETADELASWKLWFLGFEYACFALFGIEAAARLACCTEDPRYRHPVFGRLRFLVTPLMLIDVIAMLSALFTVYGTHAIVMRALRFVRIGRIFRHEAYQRAVLLLREAVSDGRELLQITILLMFAYLTVAAMVLYETEHQAQPEKVPNSFVAFYWAAVTASTVGFGDIAPITPLGRIAATVIALTGPCFTMLPPGVLVGFLITAFIRHYAKQRPGETNGGS